MATYTTNGGIKKIATGDESGTWGTSTNTNFDIIDRLSVGVGDITLSGTTHTLTTSEGASSDGQYHLVVLGGSPSGTNTITVSPNDVKRLYVVKNNSGQTATFTQGSGANVSVSNGKSAVIYCDGAGSGAAVVDVTSTFNSNTTLADLGVTATASELNIMDGVTATTAELNIMDGVTATTAELNIMDGVTATTAELNIMDGVTASTAELNYNDITTLGVVQASKTVTADASGDVRFDDSDVLNFGTGGDLQIYHDGVNSYIRDTGTGNLNVSGDEVRIINAANNEIKALFTTDGAVELYHNNAAKLATASNGITVTGNVAADSLSLNDNDIAYFGTSNDLQIYHDGSNSFIKDTGTGNLYIDASNSLYLRDIAGNAFVHLEDTGSGGVVRLYNEGSQKLHTMSTGVNIIGTALTDGVTVDGTLDIEEVYEKVNVSNGTSGAITFNTLEQGIIFYNVNQLANRTINFSNVNANLDAGQSVTCVVLMAQGSTAYYLNAYQVDGSTVTPKWQGGSAPTGGNASGIDSYSFTIIKTANAAFTVLAAQTQFA